MNIEGNQRTTVARATMNRRSEALAARLEAGAMALAAFAITLSETQWQARVPNDGRKVGVVVHHVASMYPIEIQLAQMIAAGRPIVGITWEAVAAINRDHEETNDDVTKQEALALLARNSATAARAIRDLTDNELDRAAPVSLNSDAPLHANSSSRIMPSATVTTTSPGSGLRLPASISLDVPPLPKR